MEIKRGDSEFLSSMSIPHSTSQARVFYFRTALHGARAQVKDSGLRGWSSLSHLVLLRSSAFPKVKEICTKERDYSEYI